MVGDHLGLSSWFLVFSSWFLVFSLLGSLIFRLKSPENIFQCVRCGFSGSWLGLCQNDF